MGQYWRIVNLDKKECLDCYKMGSGAKLWEQLANEQMGMALIVLCAAMPEPRGGGDFDLDKNWHGPERTFPEHNTTPGPMPEDYRTIAKRTIGRWAGDHIALVGDYAENSDLPSKYRAKTIFDKCHPKTKYVYDNNPEGARYQVSEDQTTASGRKSKNAGKYVHIIETKPAEYRDISEDVKRVIAHELHGTFKTDPKWGDHVTWSREEEKEG